MFVENTREEVRQFEAYLAGHSDAQQREGMAEATRVLQTYYDQQFETQVCALESEYSQVQAETASQLRKRTGPRPRRGCLRADLLRAALALLVQEPAQALRLATAIVRRASHQGLHHLAVHLVVVLLLSRKVSHQGKTVVLPK